MATAVNWLAWLRRRTDAEIDEEIASHLQMAIRDRIERGEAPDEARRHALLDCGSATLAREETRSVWRWIALERHERVTGVTITATRGRPS